MGFCCGTRSYSMGGVPLCSFWPVIWTSFVEDASLHLQRDLPSQLWRLGRSRCKFLGTIRYSLLSGQRFRLFTVVLLIWAAQGFDLSCKKGQKGPRVEWIGGEFSLLQDGVAVQLTEAKTQAAKDSADEILHGQAMLLVKKFVSLIGYMSWIASVAPVARDHLFRCGGEQS